MMTACMPTTPARGTRSLLSTVPETGGDKPACGQLLRHLTTGFGQPYGVRWTPPGCPLAPSHDDGGVPPGTYQSQPIKRRDDLTTYAKGPVAETALVNIDGPKTGGPFPSIKVGHTGLSKADSLIDPIVSCAGDGQGFLLIANGGGEVATHPVVDGEVLRAQPLNPW